MVNLYDSEKSISTELDFDPISGLPLRHEGEEILKLALNYLPLPYSVVEYGCGQKTSILLNLLLETGLPGYALQRGLILEADLSEDALKHARGSAQRKEPLVVKNPLHKRIHRDDKLLAALLKEAGVRMDAERSVIESGSYEIHCEPEVQFEKARSHVFTVISFWDAEDNNVVEQVLDPSLDSSKLLEIEEVRQILKAPESLLYLCPLFGRFRLEAPLLTRRQKERAGKLLATDPDQEELEWDTQVETTLRLTGARHGSLGDPNTWTYANNVPARGEEKHAAGTRERTGRGEGIRDIRQKLFLACRDRHEAKAAQQRERFSRLRREVDLDRFVQEDAQRAEKELMPLNEVVLAVSYSRSLKHLALRLESGNGFQHGLTEASTLSKMHGIGVRLRRRIEQLALCSKDSQGRIDARALNPRFFRAVCETVRQMNQAGLAVFIDRVGNLHGLQLDERERQRILTEEDADGLIPRPTLAFVSHIDTVFDAGKFDGRLGVLSGIEIFSLLRDLRRFFNAGPPNSPGSRIQVSVYCGEEMTFTGQNVSLPGSAAVSGLALPEDVFEMQNTHGERYRNRLIEMLQFLRQQQLEETAILMNRFDSDEPEQLLERCFDPTDFFTPHTYERHIEQGRVLERAKAPLTLATSVMGIRKEDFHISGEKAEWAALEFNRRLDSWIRRSAWRGARATVAILRPSREAVRICPAPFAMRLTLAGKSDHAGAATMDDRNDPGVAAGRLAKAFAERLEQLQKQLGCSLTPVAADVQIEPGQSRNVIPNKASLSLGVEERLPESLEKTLDKDIRNLCAEMFPYKPSHRGSGIDVTDLRRIGSGKVRESRKVYLTVDLRAPEKSIQAETGKQMGELLEAIAKRHKVTWTSQIQQLAEPVSLQGSGQALQIERSFGGSHNPNETQLAADLLVGTLIQLAATLKFLNDDSDSNVPLFEIVHSVIPEAWRKSVNNFSSGSLHDTCNIATAAQGIPWSRKTRLHEYR